MFYRDRGIWTNICGKQPTGNYPAAVLIKNISHCFWIRCKTFLLCCDPYKYLATTADKFSLLDYVSEFIESVQYISAKLITEVLMHNVESVMFNALCYVDATLLRKFRLFASCTFTI